MNKTATSLQSSSKHLAMTQTHNKLLSQTTKVNMSKLPDNKLKNMLLQSKLETLQDKLREKGVKTFDRFLELTQEQIDQWKDVAVGWRIKLKKQLKLSKEKKESPQAFVEFTGKSQQHEFSSQKIEKTQSPQQRNIQDIIKQRKQVKVFVPICRQIEEMPEQQNFDPEMTQEDQDVIIQSFMKVFQPRKGIISKESKFGESPRKSRSPSQDPDKKVSWSKKVQQMQKEFSMKNHKKYPKESIAKQTFRVSKEEKISSTEQIPQAKEQVAIKYCWKCFRKINIKENIGFRVIEQTESGTAKYFCSQKCQSAYEDEVSRFKGQIEEGEEDSLEMGRGSEPQDEDGLETIDLSIL